MKVTRRQFVQGGVTAFTVSFAAPAFLSDIARAQGAAQRNLVVLYLSGGNDALSTLIPYGDNFYYSRRPSIAVLPANVLQVGTDTSGKLLGLHPRLTGLRQIFNQGSLALIQRTGYTNSSRSHFLGTDIWSTANPASSSGTGWLGRYLDALPDPVDPLVAWSTVRELPHSLESREVSVAAIPSISGYSFLSPNGTTGPEAGYSRTTMTAIASHVPVDRPHVAFVNGTSQAALATLDRVASVGAYTGTVAYANNGLAQALKAVAGAIATGIGTKVFWVQLGGFDTHSAQNTNAVNAGYANLMGTVGDSMLAFYNDMRNQGLLNSTLVLQFSEFGRRISENGSQGTDHGAAGVMMAMGGGVRGGLYGTAASLNPNNVDGTLENSGNDVKYETDFRSVYARVLDNWLGTNSIPILGGDYRKSTLNFI
ncbi:MAG TPA: DUF1501 domain-containing protein [Vicinamibacterales bacterium]|nr:DUF1501 domain-containing protein [Vicinamibacterales bacterium]